MTYHLNHLIVINNIIIIATLLLYHSKNIVQHYHHTILYLIIYMKKFLHFDWLRAVQFFSKTVQKRVYSVQKEETNQAF